MKEIERERDREYFSRAQTSDNNDKDTRIEPVYADREHTEHTRENEYEMPRANAYMY